MDGTSPQILATEDHFRGKTIHLSIEMQPGREAPHELKQLVAHISRTMNPDAKTETFMELVKQASDNHNVYKIRYALHNDLSKAEAGVILQKMKNNALAMNFLDHGKENKHWSSFSESEVRNRAEQVSSRFAKHMEAHIAPDASLGSVRFGRRTMR